MKVCIVFGTRPEIIKVAPIISELKKRGIDFSVVNAGQHYDFLLMQKVLDDLNLLKIDYTLNIGSGTHAQQKASALILLENVITSNDFDIVLAEGDTNTVLATALAAIKQGVPFGHIEAGLRSFDRTMPEEINRVLTDHSSEVLFAPTEISALNLKNENIDPEKIFVVGNTIVDSFKRINKKNSTEILDKLKIEKENYAVLTMHRPENVDKKENLEKIVNLLENIKYKIVFPIHPRTKDKFIKFEMWERLQKKANLIITEPLGYVDFISLLKNARIILTDSGGIQEEACILKIPCLTLRYNTERPETIMVEGNVLVGLDVEKITKYVNKIFENKNFRESIKPKKNPFGDGNAAKKIVDILVDLHKKGCLQIKPSNFIEKNPYESEIYKKVMKGI
jgi:UDP-N-acetylglucosamine 2-epimerase (non-hydrolysing)